MIGPYINTGVKNYPPSTLALRTAPIDKTRFVACHARTTLKINIWGFVPSDANHSAVWFKVNPWGFASITPSASKMRRRPCLSTPMAVREAIWLLLMYWGVPFLTSLRGKYSLNVVIELRGRAGQGKCLPLETGQQLFEIKIFYICWRERSNNKTIVCKKSEVCIGCFLKRACVAIRNCIAVTCRRPWRQIHCKWTAIRGHIAPLSEGKRTWLCIISTRTIDELREVNMKIISRIPDSEQKSTCIELFAKHRWIISDWVIECWCRGRNYLVVWNWWSCNTTELLATNTPRTWLSTKLTALNIRCAWALANQVRSITWKRILLALLINLVAKQRWFDTALNWAWTGTQVRSIKSTAGDRRRLTNAVAGTAVSARDQTKKKHNTWNSDINTNKHEESKLQKYLDSTRPTLQSFPI